MMSRACLAASPSKTPCGVVTPATSTIKSWSGSSTGAHPSLLLRCNRNSNSDLRSITRTRFDLRVSSLRSLFSSKARGKAQANTHCRRSSKREASRSLAIPQSIISFVLGSDWALSCSSQVRTHSQETKPYRCRQTCSQLIASCLRSLTVATEAGTTSRLTIRASSRSEQMKASIRKRMPLRSMSTRSCP